MYHNKHSNCYNCIYGFEAGCLYVSGGAILEDGDGIELVQRYDSKSGEWTEVAGMLIPRSGSAACLLGGYIYVIGMNHFVVKNFMKSP